MRVRVRVRVGAWVRARASARAGRAPFDLCRADALCRVSLHQVLEESTRRGLGGVRVGVRDGVGVRVGVRVRIGAGVRVVVGLRVRGRAGLTE